MGKPKRELKKIHRRKVKKAKKMVQSLCKGEIPFEKLSQRAKHFLKKRKKQKDKSS